METTRYKKIYKLLLQIVLNYFGFVPTFEIENYCALYTQLYQFAARSINALGSKKRKEIVYRLNTQWQTQGTTSENEDVEDEEAEHDLAIGQSKIGGYPDLPEQFAWPTEKQVMLNFFAQFNCAELKMLDVCNYFPATGMVYIFIPDHFEVCCDSFSNPQYVFHLSAKQIKTMGGLINRTDKQDNDSQFTSDTTIQYFAVPRRAQIQPIRVTEARKYEPNVMFEENGDIDVLVAFSEYMGTSGLCVPVKNSANKAYLHV